MNKAFEYYFTVFGVYTLRSVPYSFVTLSIAHCFYLIILHINKRVGKRFPFNSFYN